MLDETPYFAIGSMRGVTITFSPNAVNDLSYHLTNGVVNKFHGETNVGTIGDIQFEEGMTRAEWINSEYNTVGAKIYNDRFFISGVGYLHCYDKDWNFISGSDFNTKITNDVIYDI